jgi:hypothetical protein
MLASTMKMLARVTFLTLSLLVVAAAPASAASKPVRGAHYAGKLRTGNPAPPRIAFDVSRNGAKLRDLEITYPPLLCAVGGMTPPQEDASPAPITRSGRFAKTVTFATLMGRVFATITVKGRFREHRRATGTARVRWIGGFEPGCGGTVRFSARAR